MAYEIGFNNEWTEAFGGEDDISSWLLAELMRAFFLARRAKRSTSDEQTFEARMFENIMQLRDDILDEEYHPGHGIAFIVKDPVIREIFAAPFRDRVVHHFLYNGVYEWWDRRLIYDCYSCREGKGTLFGVQRLEHHVRSVTKNFTQPAYAIKLDIQGYFMSLPRERLYERVLWGLEKQFPNGGPRSAIYKYVWKEVIFDNPTIGVRRRGNLKDWDKLPSSKSLFCQPPGRGIVIGNLSSQLLSNIYLDKLDRFVMRDLGYKHYGRYVDDFYLIVTPEELKRAKKDIELIRQFLLSLGLTLHPRKIFIQDVRHGVGFLGMVVYPGRTVPGKRIKNNFYNSLVQVQAGKKGLETVTSYMGLLKHSNSFRAQEKIFGRVGLDYLG